MVTTGCRASDLGIYDPARGKPLAINRAWLIPTARLDAAGQRGTCSTRTTVESLTRHALQLLDGHLVDSPADSVACVERDTPGDGEPTDAEVDDSGFTETGNGEIAKADEFQVTRGRTRVDKNLATQLVVAFGIGVATVYGAVPGGLATMLGPLLTTVLNAVTRVGRRRAEHGADTLLSAADKAELPVEEFFERAVADDRRHELFARALAVARRHSLAEQEARSRPCPGRWRDRRRSAYR